VSVSTDVCGARTLGVRFRSSIEYLRTAAVSLLLMAQIFSEAQLEKAVDSLATSPDSKGA